MIMRTVNIILSEVASKVYLLRWFLLASLLVLLSTLMVLNQKVEAITVSGKTQWLNQNELKKQVLDGINNKWFTTSIHEIKNTAEQVDWVATATVKRKWPSKLEINIVEQQPIACWNNFALTEQANLIAIKQCQPEWLSVQAKKAFIKDYQSLTPTLHKLEKALGQKLTAININERGTWKLKTEKKLSIVARNKDIANRLSLWIKLIENGNLPNIEQFKTVDLRYPNGFSVET